MPSLIYPALEDAFSGLLAAHKAVAVELSPDTLAGMCDDITGMTCFTPQFRRRRQVHYGHGAIIEVSGIHWALGLGMKHCPDPHDYVIADIAAIRIHIPDMDGDVDYIAPPPREPHRILYETLVANENLEHSLVLACKDGSIHVPVDGLFKSIMRAYALPALPSFITNDDRKPHEPIMYADSFPMYLRNCLHNALLIMSQQGV